jgi:hypothetical protein
VFDDPVIPQSGERRAREFNLAEARASNLHRHGARSCTCDLTQDYGDDPFANVGATDNETLTLRYYHKDR